MLENIKGDFLRSNYFRKKTTKATILNILFRTLQDSGFRAVFFYRTGRWFRIRKMGLIAALLERFMRHLSHCWISTLADIGPGFVIAYVCGIIVPPGAVFGKNCDIRQNITIGGNYGKKNEAGRTNPSIGDNVSIGAGAVILGPIYIGSNTIIGANAVVTTNIPENSVVSAFRGEVVAQRAEDGSIRRTEDRFTLSRREIYERLELLEHKIDDLKSHFGIENNDA